MMKHGVTSMTTGKVLTGTRQAVSLHRRNAVKDETGMTEICATLFTVEMHATRLKTGVRNTSALNRSIVKKGTMTTMVPTTTNHTDNVFPKGAQWGGVKAFSHDLKRVLWSLNFKSSRIEKYDGSTKPAEWLEVYQLAIEATGGDSYVMANYLPVRLSSSTRT
jgi:hypothetical protein